MRLIRRSRRYLLFLVVLLAFAAGLGYLRFLRPLPVEVVRPESQVPVKVFGLGTVEARILSGIGFKVSGTLVELGADHGDLVKSGVVLARLDSSEQESRLARASANVEKARANIQMIKANAAKARTLLAQRELVNRRRQELLRTGVVATEAAQDAQVAADAARAELEVALSEIAVAEAALKDAQAQFEFERVLLEQYTLVAPYDALVITRRKELGSVLTAGEALFTLIDPATVWARAYVDEARAGGLKVGQPAEVNLRSLPRQTFRGHITRIDIESDRVSEERRIYVACDQCPPEFHLGEQAEVYVTVALLDKALLVPQTAVRDFDGTRGLVWTVEGERLQQRQVSFGRGLLDGRLEIREGLPPGARVVGQLRPDLRIGRLARIKELDSP